MFNPSCPAAPVKIPDPSAPGRKVLDYIEPAKKIVAGDAVSPCNSAHDI
jgi:hypothetical protein